MNLILKKIVESLCKFSGEDYYIIQESNFKIQVYFSLIGLLVLAILSCSFASALYFTDQMFHNVIADIGVGIIWGYIVTNMYVLFLYTISPTLLPIKVREKQKIKTKEFTLTFSLGFRIFIIVLIATIIAQPLNVLLLMPESTALAFDIKWLLKTNPLATFFTLLIVGIFLLPVYLKYSIRNLGEFYENKAYIKRRIIEDDYEEFKKDYKRILEANITRYNNTVRENLTPYLEKLKEINTELYQKYLREIEVELSLENVEKYEYWGNPPYRTEHKIKTRNTLSEKDLLKLIYPESK